MARLKHQLFSVSKRHVTLTGEEIASLKQVGQRPMPGTIPHEHRNRLMKAGYIREVVRAPRSALVLTGRGIARLAVDK
jgi:hypothetical protein